MGTITMRMSYFDVKQINKSVKQVDVTRVMSFDFWYLETSHGRVSTTYILDQSIKINKTN